MDHRKKYKVIACEILFREVCLCAAFSKNIVDLQFMAKGLHDIGEEKMVKRLQDEIDQTDPEKYDAILLVYGLCNNGVRGLHAPIPLVIPRAHDCITLLLGSKERYQEYFKSNPGTYFMSPGWIERDNGVDGENNSITTQLGIDRTYEDYLSQYGEDNAKYLIEQLGNWSNNYQKMTYIDTGTGDSKSNKKISHEMAQEKNWIYEEINGNISLIQKLFSGNWNDKEFLVVKPNNKIIASFDENIICFDN